MSTQCPSCNKFCGLESQDPEVNELEIQGTEAGCDLNCATVTAEVRILRNSACCGDEMKEYTFNSEVDIPSSIVGKMQEVRKADPEAEFDAQEDQIEATEKGGHRYQKSFFGFSMTVGIYADSNGKSQELGTVVIADQIEASAMDELN
jgi:hypothetical protein